MSELSRRVLHVRRHVDVTLDEAALARGLTRLERGIVSRRRRARAASTLALLGALALAWFAWTRAPAAEVLATHDGSTARALGADTALSLERESEREVTVQLTRGAGQFDVTRNPARRYRVRAGRVTVQVLGTAFEVRRAPGRVFVRVQRGAVEVAWPAGTTVLAAGAERWFSEASAPPEDAPQQPAREQSANAQVRASGANVEALRAAHARRVPARAQDPAGWRELARAGKHREAFQSLGATEVDDLDGLLLAADAARLSGHPREAVAHLTRLIERYPNDVRARLAAFTLGRIALHELDRPLLAAQSFARAYALDPNGELAADALAREAEAYHRAGDALRARAAAERYLARFPEGSRRKEVESYAKTR